MKPVSKQWAAGHYPPYSWAPWRFLHKSKKHAVKVQESVFRVWISSEFQWSLYFVSYVTNSRNLSQKYDVLRSLSQKWILLRWSRRSLLRHALREELECEVRNTFFYLKSMQVESVLHEVVQPYNAMRRLYINQTTMQQRNGMWRNKSGEESIPYTKHS